MGAREKLVAVGFPEAAADELLAEHRLEIAAQVREYQDHLRAEDWGKSNRTKVAWLRAIEVIRKNVILKGIKL